MNEPETYVLCRRQEAANALGAVAPDAVRGRGVKYLVVPPGESFDRAAQRLRAGDETAHIIFVVEEDTALQPWHMNIQAYCSRRNADSSHMRMP